MKAFGKFYESFHSTWSGTIIQQDPLLETFRAKHQSVIYVAIGGNACFHLKNVSFQKHIPQIANPNNFLPMIFFISSLTKYFQYSLYSPMHRAMQPSSFSKLLEFPSHPPKLKVSHSPVLKLKNQRTKRPSQDPGSACWKQAAVGEIENELFRLNFRQC